ncbi:hypothetical protein CJF30_00010919 [Rutstroemia sp. NJR-2017a BBW]|nr:hypothetical protein CJF30_00010919 [Rutstroemia sp. NJR-2017a BBW]
MAKLIVILGITGNQGGSVAARFLRDSNFTIRGITRNPSSTAAQNLSAQGIQIVQADLEDPASLVSAFRGANIIFSVTNYWETFYSPSGRARTAELGISIREYAGIVEERQGRNIADAAASEEILEGLDENGFLVSTLSWAEKCSEGQFRELYHFDAKAKVFPGYVTERHPGLAKKMSCVQTGYFMSSYKLATRSYFGKLPDGTFQMSFPTDPDKPVPHFAVNADMGNFVYAVSQLPPGRSYMAAGSICSWKDYLRIWSEVTGVQAIYKQITLEEMIENSPDKEMAKEIGDMFAYSSDPGYDGGDESIWTVKDVIKAGIECPMTTLEDFMKAEDWGMVLSL